MTIQHGSRKSTLGSQRRARNVALPLRQRTRKLAAEDALINRTNPKGALRKQYLTATVQDIMRQMGTISSRKQRSGVAVMAIPQASICTFKL